MVDLKVPALQPTHMDPPIELPYGTTSGKPITPPVLYRNIYLPLYTASQFTVSQGTGVAVVRIV
jgi:hypothetical protein